MVEINDKQAGAVSVKPRRSCNIHIDCDAADEKQRARRAARLAEVKKAKAEDEAAGLPFYPSGGRQGQRFPLPAFRYVEDMHDCAVHCDDEGCKDCFGN